jgi:hypothetical protein
MELSPHREANSRVATLEIHHLLWNPNIYYCVHKTPPLVPSLSQINPVPNFSPYIYKFLSNIVLPCTPRLSEWSLPFTFTFLIYFMRATYPAHLILFYMIV